MKKLMICLLCFSLLCGCGAKPDPLGRVTELLGVDVSDFMVTTYYNTHGGFHGDGQTVIIMQLTEEQMLHLDQTTASHFCRYDLPFSDPVRITLYGGDFMRGGAEWYRAPMFKNQNGTTLLPEITNGFYLFYDRHGESTDPSNDANLYNRGSYNFDLAVFDRDTNVLYYLVMDT